MESYNPATISSADLESVLARLDRYLRRHGSPYGETPIQADQLDDVRQSIILEWMADDWTRREFESLSRYGRSLFPPTLSTLGQHLRGILFHAGRSRRRGWRAEGATRRVADRRRDPGEFRGIGSGSVSADPARIVSAVESVSGELILSPRAIRHRSRRGLPLKYSGGVSAVSSKAPESFRVMKRRNTKGIFVRIVSRHSDRTCIEFAEWTRYNFERVGQVPHRVEDNAHYRPTMGIGRVVRSRPNPARAATRRKLPAGFGSAECREAIG